MILQPAERGQVLVFVALVLPIVLLPAAAFAVDAASVAAAHAQLEQATASGAESAVQQINAHELRSGAGFALDEAMVAEVAREVVAGTDPQATVDRVAVVGLDVIVDASQSVELPLNFLGAPAVRLRSRAAARLALGYESPSSFLPFSVSTL